MPTGTFYHLPQKKRQKLIDAIHGELLRVPYEEISINKIIQNAGISRGSFYQYFMDKSDLMQTILRDFQKRVQDITKESLHRNHGDPFTVTQDIFDMFCRAFAHTDLRLLCQNLLAGMKIKDERISYLPFSLTLNNINCIPLLLLIRRMNATNNRNIHIQIVGQSAQCL